MQKPRRMPLQAALDFVKRQTEWLSHRNLQDTEAFEPLDDLNLEEARDSLRLSLRPHSLPASLL